MSKNGEALQIVPFSDSAAGVETKDEVEPSSDIIVYEASHRRDEANPFFINDLEYTKAEEARVIHVLDTRLLPWMLLTTFVLNMDRTNNSNAISDDLPANLGFNFNVVNTATAIYSALFSIMCVNGAVVAKIIEPSRWIAIQMVSFSLVTMAHALIKNKAGYLTVRCFSAISAGGVTPTILVYLGGFYKNTELATRLACCWGMEHIAAGVSGFIASGLFQLSGVSGLFGWQWLFIVDGIITFVVAILTWFYLPSDVSRMKGGIRGSRSWFDERQIQIVVTRIIRDDATKRAYETKVTWADIKDSVTDLSLWGHLIRTPIGMTPLSPLKTYLPTVIKSFNFNVVASNALTAPPYFLQCFMSIALIWHSDRVHERGWHGTVGAGWFLAGWIFVRALPHDTSKIVKYIAVSLTLGWPSTLALNVAWMSENMSSVGKRTIAMGAVDARANIYGLWGSQIYQADDSPDYRRGNTINIVFAGVAVLLWIAQKAYHKHCNVKNARKLASMSDAQREREEAEAESKGNRSVTFHFTT